MLHEAVKNREYFRRYGTPSCYSLSQISLPYDYSKAKRICQYLCHTYGKSKITIKDCKRQLRNILNELKQISNEYNDIADNIRKVIIQLQKITEPFLLEILQEKYRSLKQSMDDKEKEYRRLGNLHTELEEKIREMRSSVEINEQMTIHEKAEFFNKTFSKVEWIGEKFKRSGKLTIYFKNGDEIAIEMLNK